MTTTLDKPRSRKRKGGKPLRPSLGRWICPWIERNLVHAEGDYYGKPFELKAFERDAIWRAYELRADGTRRYRQVLLGLPKGNGKTELAAAIGCAEFLGPVVFDGWDANGHPSRPRRRLSPDVPMAAASLKQANLVFTAARTMLLQGRLGHQVEPYQLEVLLKQSPGKLYRVAAVAGTNDGLKPSFFLADELHEWACTCPSFEGVHLDACKARVHEVLSNGRAKRQGAWELNISTAGWNLRSVLGGLYERGRRIADGLEDEDGFLFIWYEPDGEVDLTDETALRRAIHQANPAADDFLPMDNLLAHAREKHEITFRRYHLNQWVTSPHHWIDKPTWDTCAASEGLPPDGSAVVLGFDGSYSRDSTGVVIAGVDEPSHLAVLACWERDEERDPEWRVDILEVEALIREACKRWDVRWVGCDTHRWARSLELLEGEGYPVVRWPTHSEVRFGPACGEFRDAVLHRRLTHDGDDRLARHVTNAVLKASARDPRIMKEHKDSVRRIDLAVAAVIAYDMAIRARADLGSWTPL